MKGSIFEINAERVKEAMKAKGMGFEELAAGTGLAYKTASAILCRGTAYQDSAASIARVLGIGIDEFAKLKKGAKSKPAKAANGRRRAFCINPKKSPGKFRVEIRHIHCTRVNGVYTEREWIE